MLLFSNCKIIYRNFKMSTRYAYAKPSRNDPFYEPPLHKAFYHPSLQQDLPDDKKWVALSSDKMRLPPDARDVHFLKATNTFQSHTTPDGTSPGDDTAKFDESWPVSERPSTLDLAPDECDYGSLQPDGSGSLLDSSPMKPISALIKEYASLGKGRENQHKKYIDLISEIDSTVISQTTSTSEQRPKESTLSKYIERFRHGAPLSREEREQRQRTTDPTDFWWLGSSSPQGSSTPRDLSGSDPPSVRSRVKGQHGSLTARSKFSTASESSRATFARTETDLDSETRKLNDKTDRLLERSESSLDSSAPVVSTVGLGSDTSGLSTSRDAPAGPAPREAAYLPSFVTSGRERFGPEARDVRGVSRRPLKREDDILYQWRQQRRLEGIRHKATRLLDAPGPGSVRSTVTDNVESRLADFRRRIGGTHQDRAMCHQSREQHTSRPEDNKTIEEVIKAQDLPKVHADAFCQTSLDAEASPAKPREAPTDHGPIASTLHSSPIASPLINQKKLTLSTAESELEPHFHLSCDIIPCPHGHGSPKKPSGPHGRKPRSYHSDTDTDESNPRSRRNHSDEEPVKDIGPLVIDSCSDFEYENYKRQHLEELSRELEACSVQGESGRSRAAGAQSKGEDKHTRASRDSTIEKGRRDEERRPRERSRERDRRKESRERDNSHGKQSERVGKSHRKTERSRSREEGVKHRQSDRSDRLERVDSRKDRESSRKSERSTSREDRDRKSDKKSEKGKERDQGDSQSERSLQGEGGGWQRKDLQREPNKQQPNHTSTTSNSSVHTGESSSDEKLPTARGRSAVGAGSISKPRSGRGSPQPRGGQPGGRKERDRRGQKEEPVRHSGGGLTDVSINDVTPICHSSPIRGQRAITPTIQQVVTERLFNGSSVNETTAEGTEKREEAPVRSQDNDELCSDGEEFPEDDLLQELRARREHFQQRLEILNQLIALTSEV